MEKLVSAWRALQDMRKIRLLRFAVLCGKYYTSLTVNWTVLLSINATLSIFRKDNSLIHLTGYDTVHASLTARYYVVNNEANEVEQKLPKTS